MLELIWSLVLGAWCLELGAWSLVLGGWCLVLGALVLCFADVAVLVQKPPARIRASAAVEATGIIGPLGDR